MANPSLLESPVLVIVGPTASGKTSLAISIAKKYDGEIISADSRAIYKGIDIASAKPMVSEQQGIKHWGLDVAGPDSNFTVADFKQYALQKIAEIHAREKLPIVVGGSGLYIDALIYDYQFGAQSDPGLRAKLNRMTVPELQDYCKNNNIKQPCNNNNKRYLVRAIENNRAGQSGNANRDFIQPQYIVVGITTKKEELNTKIKQRTKAMLAAGLVEEYKKINKIYPKDSEAMRTNAYRIIETYLEEGFSEVELLERLARADRKLVKKQKTWFKRNSEIVWVGLDEAEKIIKGLLIIAHQTLLF